jgi:hypothetical protein
MRDDIADAYRMLDLSPGASMEEVRAAYLDLIRVWHPDRLQNESERLRKRGEEKLKALNRAYERLRTAGPAPASPAGAPKMPLHLTLINFGNRWGFVDDAGRPVIYPEFAAARSFSEGLAAVRLIDKWGYINTQGEFAIAPLYDACGDFHSGLAPVSWYRRWGFIDPQGRFVIQPRYQEARQFEGEWAPVRLAERWGRVNRRGEATFTEARPERTLA